MTAQKSLAVECAVASIGIVVLIGGLKHVGAGIGWFGDFAFTIAAGAQLYIPIFLIGRRGITADDVGIETAGWPRDLVLALGLGLLTIIPFVIGHHIYQTEAFGRRWSFALPDAFFYTALTQIFAIALPEELFFRGYLQRRFEKLWPARRRLFGTPFGMAIIVSSAVFALAHFAGEYNPMRLGPFFPSLLFGLLRTRTNRIVAPVAYHAFCNLLSETLFASYLPG